MVCKDYCVLCNCEFSGCRELSLEPHGACAHHQCAGFRLNGSRCPRAKQTDSEFCMGHWFDAERANATLEENVGI